MNAEDFWQWVATGVLGMFGALISWVGGKQVARIEALEAGKANERSVERRFDETLQRIDEHQQEDRDTHREIKNELITLNGQVHKTNETLAGLVGTLKGNGTLK